MTCPLCNNDEEACTCTQDAYWDDPNNDMNFLVDIAGQDVYEGITVYAPRGLTILRERGDVTYPENARFVVERINMDNGVLLVHPEGDETMQHNVLITHFRAIDDV